MIVTGARHDCLIYSPGIVDPDRSMSYPVGGAAAPSLASVLFRFKRARALIGILLFPRPQEFLRSQHPFVPIEIYDLGDIHVPSGRGTATRRHSYSPIVLPTGGTLYSLMKRRSLSSRSAKLKRYLPYE